jgi:hypothetical protein
MAEQTPVPDGKFESLDLVLHHRPAEKRYNLWNFLMRPQSLRGRAFIARSLLGKPTDLPCWRWEDEAWPAQWDRIRRHPLRAALHDLTRGFLATLRNQWRLEKRLFFKPALGVALFHAGLDIQHWRLRRAAEREAAAKPDASTRPQHQS